MPAVAGDARGQIADQIAHRAVFADADLHRVEVGDRVDGLQRPRPPRVGEHRVDDGADRVASDLRAVALGRVRRDVTHDHAAGVQPKDLVVRARQLRLALADELGLKAGRHSRAAP